MQRGDGFERKPSCACGIRRLCHDIHSNTGSSILMEKMTFRNQIGAPYFPRYFSSLPISNGYLVSGSLAGCVGSRLAGLGSVTHSTQWTS